MGIIKYLYIVLIVYHLFLNLLQLRIIKCLRFAKSYNLFLIEDHCMQADYQILPKRNGNSDGSFRQLNPIRFYTNYYEVDIGLDKGAIYQYSFALEQAIPQDSPLYRKAVRSVLKDLKQKIGLLANSGQMLWGSKLLKLPTTFKCNFTQEQKKYELEAIVKLTKQLNVKDLSQEAMKPHYLQILNVSLKNTLRAMKLSEIGKPGQYFQKEYDGSDELDDKGLKVLKGFRFTITPLNSGIYLQVDVCSRVVQAKNLLEAFNGHNRDQIVQEFTGATVITNYGRYKTYRVEEVDFNKSPLSTFHSEQTGKDITFAEYYKNSYGLSIKNTKQPLIKVVRNIEKVIDKDTKKIKQIKHFVYLVPELVSPTGMTDAQRADYRTMKALDPFTKLAPTERVRQTAGAIEKFNNVSDSIKIKNVKRLEGYCLPRPELTFQGSKITPDNRGNIKHRGVLKEAYFFADWLFAYSLSKNPKNDDEDADDAIELLKKAGESYGVKFKNPGFATIKGNSIKDWKDTLKKDIEDHGTPKIIVVYVNQYEQKIYGELKRYITNELKCASQFIRKKTLTNQKGAMSAASKIVIQMNVKVGAVPWQVEKRHPYFKGKNLMYGALSISKGDRGHTLAFVGTINSECTKVFSACKYGIKDKENIPVKDIEDIFVNWAKSYYQNNNRKAPELIILYREGLSIPQTAAQIPKMEIPALEGMIQEIGSKAKIPNYKPQLMVVIVNKKINNRYYAVGRENQQNPNKFVPELFNVDSGSILAEPLSQDDSYDFHLAAQYVTQGTCTPTLFRVAYDSTNMPQQALMTFTFEQCFNYYNWEGAVKVPACLQCADKLSKLVSMSIKANIEDSPLTKQQHFFL